MEEINLNINKLLTDHIKRIEDKKMEILLQRINERVGKFDKIEDVPKENLSAFIKVGKFRTISCFFIDGENEPIHLVTFFEQDAFSDYCNMFRDLSPFEFETKIKYT